MMGMTGRQFGWVVGFDDCVTGEYLQRAACLAALTNLAVNESTPEEAPEIRFSIRRAAIDASLGQDMKGYVLCTLGGDKVSEDYFSAFNWAVVAALITNKTPDPTSGARQGQGNERLQGNRGQPSRPRQWTRW
jgi:hypothetical protein